MDPHTQTNYFSELRLITSFLLMTAVALLIVFVTQKSNGQGIDTDSSRPLIHQSGQLFTVRFAPSGSRFDVIAVGKPFIVLDPSKIEVFGRVIDLEGRRREFSIRWRRGYYEIAEPIDSRLKLEIEVIQPSTKQSETFDFLPPIPYF